MAEHDDAQRRRPHPQTMAGPFLEFDLAREIDQLQREPRPASGQNAKTLAKHDDFRIVLSPFAAKRLSLLLGSVVKEYESRFGTLNVEPGTVQGGGAVAATRK